MTDGDRLSLAIIAIVAGAALVRPLQVSQKPQNRPPNGRRSHSKPLEIIDDFPARTGLTRRRSIRIFRPLSEFTPARPGLFVE
jgi:hypothetical protein